MIRTLDFNAFSAGTIIDDEYADLGVTVSASGGSGDAMIFDSANPRVATTIWPPTRLKVC